MVPEALKLCTIHFDRDKRRPVRVNNESKACLDDIALTMGQQSGAKLEIIGDASEDEKPEAAAERALNEREYLTKAKGVDISRIEVRVGEVSTRKARNILVPAGAVFDEANTQSIPEGTIQRSGEAYGTGSSLPAAHHRSPHRRHRRVAKSADASATAAAQPQ